MKAIYFNKVAAAKFLLSQGIDFTIKNGVSFRFSISNI